MIANADPPPSADTIAAQLLSLSAEYAPTPLLDLPRLATRLGVAQVLAKDEGRRMLGSFKSLGGTYAGLRALARLAGSDIAGLLAAQPRDLPPLLCASDGNHGLAVATAARLAGAQAAIYLHAGVPALRARRIEAQGGRVVRVAGTYDDAVDAAAAAARKGAGILIPDTSDDPADPTVADVMAGYGVIAAELRREADDAQLPRPTHLFVQAGVGGLAAAIIAGLQGWLAPPAMFVVVEPEKAACVGAALAADERVRLTDDLDTAAEMLSCGEASMAALPVLRQHGARFVTVSEVELVAAPLLLRDHGGPASTPSGACGLAGLARAATDPAIAARLHLSSGSRVLLVVSEAELEAAVDTGTASA